MESIVASYHRHLSQRDPLKLDPRCVEPVKVRVLDGFWHRGAPVHPGETVTLERFDAEQLQRLGKVEILK